MCWSRGRDPSAGNQLSVSALSPFPPPSPPLFPPSVVFFFHDGLPPNLSSCRCLYLWIIFIPFSSRSNRSAHLPSTQAPPPFLSSSFAQLSFFSFFNPPICSPLLILFSSLPTKSSLLLPHILIIQPPLLSLPLPLFLLHLLPPPLFHLSLLPPLFIPTYLSPLCSFIVLSLDMVTALQWWTYPLLHRLCAAAGYK